jgi:hypothetical protein
MTLAPSNGGGWDQAAANRLRPRLETEVINRIDSDVKTTDGCHPECGWYFTRRDLQQLEGPLTSFSF